MPADGTTAQRQTVLLVALPATWLGVSVGLSRSRARRSTRGPPSALRCRTEREESTNDLVAGDARVNTAEAVS